MSTSHLRHAIKSQSVKQLFTNPAGSRISSGGWTLRVQGRMRTMQTWQNFTGNTGSGTTTWSYDPTRGWLTNKSYADVKGS